MSCQSLFQEKVFSRSFLRTNIFIYFKKIFCFKCKYYWDSKYWK